MNEITGKRHARKGEQNSPVRFHENLKMMRM